VSDRRHKLVRLTEKGQALIQELRATRVNSIVQRMLLLPPDLLDRAIDVLRDVTEQLPPTIVAHSCERP
jgi:DNA-binding MarR family transcriptional regulator